MTGNPAPAEPFKEFVTFARELAIAARRATLPHFGKAGPVYDKGQDGRYDPVTEADRAAEQAMRALIGKRFPDHGIRGEELPDKPGAGRYAWSLDPVDGTRSFMCGLPTWTTLIALLEECEPVLGLVDAPVLDETCFASGNEAWLLRGGERTRIRTSGCTGLAEARLSTTDPFLFGDDEGRGPPDAFAAFDRLRRAARVTRYGHDGYAYARLAAGSLDLVVESGLKPHDYNPLIPLVRAAGGHVGDWRGGTDFAPGAIVAAASRELYDAAVELLAVE